MNYTRETLRHLFNSPFALDEWQGFLHGFFGAAAIKKTPQKVSVPPTEAADGVEGFLLGEMTTSDGLRVGLFRYIVPAAQIGRRRVGLRQLVAPWVRYNYDAALVVFTDRNAPAWRFSLVCDIDGGTTAPKRFTYVFGDPATPPRTPLDRFLELQSSRANDKPLSFASMRDAFSVEALSDEFFSKYKEHYENFVSYVTGKRFVKKDSEWVEIEVQQPHRTLYATFNRDDKNVRDYVKKLLGRLVFLHFLQKKGWLGASAGTWADGDRAFLLHLFEKASPEQKEDFLDGVLEKLFFNALNTDRSSLGDFFTTGVRGVGKCRIPYLNGGLFERDELDKLRVKFPAEMFEKLLNFFAEYNFTIDENDPNEAEVGIDPEMLGRIFENLLEDNKDKGAFYTPKEIVGYMCRQSLLAYLSEGRTDGEKAIIETFLDTHDAAPLPPALVGELSARLQIVKICDPAIGSGAFPMGLLRLLCSLREALGDGENGADLKRSVIENNIYGVDIEKGAVDIARLRFWLSLVVDETEPSPLPNLDFKIMQGNSLVESWKGHDLSHLADQNTMTVETEDLPGFPSRPVQLELISRDADRLRKHLRDLLHDWYSCSDHYERERLRVAIRAAVEEQISSLFPDFSFGDLDPSANMKFFLWHLWFSEVFDQGGFDIVIGNPPYISAPTQIAHPVLAAQRKAVATSGRYPSLFEKWDLYLAFLELGMRHLLRAGGQLAMIVPYPLANQKYARKFRKAAIREWTLSELADLRGVKVFANATVTNSIPFLEKSPPRDDGLWISRADENGNITRSFRQPFSRLVIDDKTAVWNTDETERSTSRHADMYTLGDFCYISIGMVLNADEKMAKGEFTKEELISETQDEIHCKKYIEGKDLDRYSVKRVRFLEYGTKRSPGQLRRPTFENLYVNDKLLINALGDLKVAVDFGHHYYCEQQVRMALLWKDLRDVQNKSISLSVKKFCTMSRDEMEKLSEKIDLRYLLGILNSKYGAVLLNNNRGGDYHITPEPLRAIPIPLVSTDKQARIASLVDRILAAKAADPAANTSELEKDIDDLVYKLYGLSPDEIKIVKGEKQ